MLHVFIIVDIVKTILQFSIPFKKICSKKFVSARTVDIVRDIMGSECLTGMLSWSYYRYIWVFKIILRYESVPSQVESLNSDDTGLKRLEIFHVAVILFYMATTKELSTLIRAARNLAKSPNKPDPINSPTF